MRTILFAMALALLTFNGAPASAGTTTIKGAGATFPYPLYAWWALRYGKETDTKIDYDSVGSGGGIKQIQDKAVDFGASDAPLSTEELKKRGLIQFATVLGGVVPVVNIPGIASGKLKLSGPVLANIFLGKVDRWNDPTIVALNPQLDLPNLPIRVLHRAKASGTTWIFTNYLSKVSPAFKQQVGNGKEVNWPVGLAAKGNEGIIEEVQATEGAIGYSEYAYAVQSETSYAQLLNKAGHFVQPNRASFQAAAASVDWNSKQADVVLTDKPGKAAWPITGATFILMHKTQADAQKAKAMLQFFAWCYGNGGRFAEYLDYVPLPQDLVGTIRSEWSQVRGRNGEAVWP